MTLMHDETREIPQVVARLVERSAPAIREAGAHLRRLAPPVVVTVARGSSDHAATVFQYACAIARGVPVASLGPSIASIYGASLSLKGAAAVAISQSGKSPDLLALADATKIGGGILVAITNDEGSPLAAASDHVIALQAGPERSVAATKTFVASVVAALALMAEWGDDAALREALQALPGDLEKALACDWSAAIPAFTHMASCFVLGRGPGFGLALEAALKLKETAVLHAEAFSGAEVQHGPVSLVRGAFPVLALVPDDAAKPSLLASIETLRRQGARVYAASTDAAGDVPLPITPARHPLTAPLCAIVAFYRFVEMLTRARGFEPDTPQNLAKVTQTL